MDERVSQLYEGLCSLHLPVVVLERDRSPRRGRLTLAGMGCYAAMLGVTLSRNVTINQRLLELGPGEQEEFRALRARWDRLHAIRNLLNLTGLGLTVAGALPPARRPGWWMRLRG